jgi:CheY-like chemotaxis protein
MPGMNGIDLVIAIRVEIPRCKILLFAGQVGAPDLIKKAAEAGHRSQLTTKPIHPAKIGGSLTQSLIVRLDSTLVASRHF